MKKVLIITSIMAIFWIPPELSAQRVIEVNPNYLSSKASEYGDADGDGILERIGRFGKVYNYPEGSIPDPDNEGYYLTPYSEGMYYSIVDGVGYYRCRKPDPNISMGSYYPQDREPDFSEGEYDFFRITSIDDVRLWFGSTMSMESLRNTVFTNGLLYTRSDNPVTSTTDQRLTWIKPDGSLIYINGTENAVETRMIIADFNADGRADVFFGVGKLNNYYKWEMVSWAVAYSTGDGTDYSIKNFDGVNIDYQLTDAIVTDFNRDGRKDIFLFHSEGWAQPYEPFTLLQMEDGSFITQPLNVVTDPAEIAKAQFSDGGNGSFTNNSINMSGMAGGDKGVSFAESVRMEAVDINMDGYPDLIDPKGNTFLSLPDGRYYSAAIAGSVTVADINGDGVKDLVIFDENTGDVTLNLSHGTAGFDSKVLFSNENVTDVICRDLDGDKQSDILLLADTPRSQQYAYIVFFHNNGDGTFKKTERAINGTREFYGIYDFNMNGCPTIVARDGNSGQHYRIDWNTSFSITETPLLPDNYIAEYYDNLTFRPYLGDGYVYLPVYEKENGYNIGNRLISLTPATTENTAPDRLDMPRVIADKSTGDIKVEWDSGSDKENASEDLKYEIRMKGSTPLYSDILSGNTFVIANAGSWPSGNIAVQVRAIDQNGLAGQWSEAAEFNNTSVGAPFAISSSSISLADTLVVTLLSDATATFRAMPDGKIISDDDKTVRILFDDFGTKIIEATVAGSSIAMTQKLNVSPLRSAPYSPVGQPIDLDTDGQVELVDEKITIFQNGDYVEYPSLSLSDVSLNTQFTFDKNMDGQPDIYGWHQKGSNKFSWLINNKDLDFTVDAEDYTLTNGSKWNSYQHKACDFNNDGLPDFYYNRIIYRNLGDGQLEALEQRYPDGECSASEMVVADFNRDGLMDYLLLGDIYNKSAERYFLAINKGDFRFEMTELPILSGANIATVKAIDVNGDGWTDITYSSGNWDSYNYKAVLGGADLGFNETIELPGLPLGFDFDNDGRLDYATAADSLLLNRIDGPQTAAVDMSEDFNNFYHEPYYLFDLNNDGYPDGYDNFSIGWLYSGYTNTAPTAPTSVLVTQNQDNVTLNWSGATDAESPSVYLRYNVSIREKGTDKYVISPLNGTSDISATPHPGWDAYRTASTMAIPFGRFEAGKTYEVRIQTIDQWYSHSPFSEPVKFTPSAIGLITMPVKGGVGIPVEFSYRDNVEGQFTVNADGGTVKDNTITWDSPGLKTVVVTINSLRSEHKIMIEERPQLDIVLPTKVLAGTVLNVELPQIFSNENGTASITINEGSVEVYPAANMAKIILPETDGNITLKITYENDIFGKTMSEKTITVIGSDFRPEISMVSVENGVNVIKWDKSMQLPEKSLFNGTVHVYKETYVANEFVKVAEVTLSDGSWTDTTSSPEVKTSRYILTMGTVYDSETRPGRVHGNLHLMINRGLGNDINLHWMPYEGAEIAQYTILAGTEPDNLSVLDNISGNSQSYTHKRTDNSTMYYSLTYTLSNTEKVQSFKSGKAPAETTNGYSNIISTADAYSITMVEDIDIYTQEGVYELSETVPQLHLQAIVTPVVSTVANVEWSIIGGGNLASINTEGVLTIKDNTTGGIITVQAKAVDGSGVTATADFTVSAFSDIAITEDVQLPEITVEGRYVIVSGMTNNTNILVTDISGRVEYSDNTSGTIRIGTLPNGIHIIRAGSVVKKIFIR